MRSNTEKDEMNLIPEIVCIRSTTDISHSFLILNGNDSMVVDCGSEKMSEKIAKTIKNKGLEFENFKKIILTHTHFDHVRGVKSLKKFLPKADILVHEAEYECLMKGESIIPKSTSGFSCYSETYNKIPVFKDLKDSIKKIEGDCALDEDGLIKVIHVEGHSSGSICIYVGEKMIVGDTCEGYNFSAFVSFAEDLGLLMKSWKKILDIKEIKTLLPGHGDEIDIKILDMDYAVMKHRFI